MPSQNTTENASLPKMSGRRQLGGLMEGYYLGETQLTINGVGLLKREIQKKRFLRLLEATLLELAPMALLIWLAMSVSGHLLSCIYLQRAIGRMRRKRVIAPRKYLAWVLSRAAADGPSVRASPRKDVQEALRLRFIQTSNMASAAPRTSPPSINTFSHLSRPNDHGP